MSTTVPITWTTLPFAIYYLPALLDKVISGEAFFSEPY